MPHNVRTNFHISPLAPEIVVEQGDALTTSSDVLALKFADGLYGVDRAACHALTSRVPDISDYLPSAGNFLVTPSRDAIAARDVLFVGVGPLPFFGYAQIRAFARRVLEVLASEKPNTAHVTLTLHGPGYGLDESEAFTAELAGLREALEKEAYPRALRRITILEANVQRAERLGLLMEQLRPSVVRRTSPGRTTRSMFADELSSAGNESNKKPHIFVAMPFAEEMDDIFYYGIQGAVKAAGYLCERADLSSFTGDVMDWVKNRIASASLVIADLSDANPNVYLEVGYAWGCGRPTVLIVKDTQQLKFDVRGQRCLPYRKIRDLEASLRAELLNLKI
ncbi:hypothetical protein BH10PSE6_BH10PSE6_11600 [soil metagenome]